MGIKTQFVHYDFAIHQHSEKPPHHMGIKTDTPLII